MTPLEVQNQRVMLRQDKPDSGVDLPVSIFVETCQEDILSVI